MIYMQPLKQDHPGTAWCVPTAYAFLTGVALAKAHSMFAFIQQKDALGDVSGAHVGELAVLLRQHGMALKPYAHRASTLAGVAKEWAHEVYPLLVNLETKASAHVVLTHRGYLADNWTLRAVPLAQFPRPLRRAYGAWAVVPCNPDNGD